MTTVTRPVLGAEREELRQRWDKELRRRLKLRAKPVARSGQCHGSNYLGSRCDNTASPGCDYCYAHRIRPMTTPSKGEK